MKSYKVEATYKNELGNKTKIERQLQGKKCGAGKAFGQRARGTVRRADVGSGRGTAR